MKFFKRYWNNTVRLYFDKEVLLRHRILAIFFVFSALSSLAFAISHIILQSNILYILPSVFTAIIGIILPGFTDDINYTFAYSVLLYVTYLYFPYLYFLMGGVKGLTPMLFVIGVFFNVMILKKEQRYAIVAPILVIYIALLIIGYFFPVMIAPYKSGTTASVDYAMILILSGFIVLTSIFSIIRSDELNRANIKRMLRLLEKNNEELIAAKNETETAIVARGDFLANVSHEIRTPMNAIIGMCDLLGEEHLSDKQTDYLKDISVSAKSLLSIVNDILDFSKIKADKMEIIPVDFELSVLLENVKSMFLPEIAKRGLDLEFTVSKSVPQYIFMDDTRLRQILINLLSNAVKFTQIGRVILNVDAVDDKLVFNIIDTGTGIKKEEREKIFDAFERVDKVKTRTIAGTGLGLHITKTLVDLMKGEINIESEYEKGTHVTVSLPLKAGMKERINVINPERPFIAPTANILIVDDNMVNQRVIAGMLELKKITVDTADNGIEAIKKISENSYDIVFLDHMMPKLDGIETTKILRSSGYNPDDLIIIALSANVSDKMRETYIRFGMQDFMPKPFTKTVLDAMLLRWLDAKKIVFESADSASENPAYAAVLSEDMHDKDFTEKAKDVLRKRLPALKSEYANLLEKNNADDMSKFKNKLEVMLKNCDINKNKGIVNTLDNYDELFVKLEELLK